MPRYDRLKELLSDESYPHRFTFKFVGKNTPLFDTGLKFFEAECPRLRRQAARPSKGDKHLAMTYVLEALDPDEIIGVYRKIEQIPDILLML
jgi:putative lipoic acid-binding regulatory protein